jgi:hypothetical protein
VPDDVRPVLGKREVVRALRTADARGIAAEVRRLCADYDRRFEEARARALAPPTVAPTAAAVALEVEPADLIDVAFAWFDQEEGTALPAPALVEPGTECCVFRQLRERCATLAGPLFGEEAARLRAEALRLAQARWPDRGLADSSNAALIELLRRASLESLQRSLARLPATLSVAIRCSSSHARSCCAA